MIVTLLGVRGSRPVAMMDTLRYGGNTTSFKIEIHDMPPIFIDGGTGLYEDGIKLVSEGKTKKIYFFITHTHWDHILALPYFRPLYEKDYNVAFHAPISRNQPFVKLMKGQHNPMAFPVPYSHLKAEQTFIDTKPGDAFEIEKAKVSCHQLNHPGTTLGWRFEADDRIVAIVTDTAPIKGNYLGEGMAESAVNDPGKFEKEWTEDLIRFMSDADLVIYDTHFTDEGIKGKEHWGHSTPSMAIANCCAANAKRLILHHHAPEDTDHLVDKKVEQAQEANKNPNLQVEAGMEGMKIWL